MICDKCGKLNEDGNKFCNYCGEVFLSNDTTNTPLTGLDRVKVGGLFAMLILPYIDNLQQNDDSGTSGFMLIIFLFVPLLILFSSIYIMKKDKTFLSILNAKKYIKIYLSLLVFSSAVLIGVDYYFHDGKYVDNPAYKLNPNYNEFNYTERHKYIINEELAEFDNPNPGVRTYGVVAASIFGFSILGVFLMFLFNALFFDPLNRHQTWVIRNGIFADINKTSFDIICSNCGRELKSQGNFCPNCGHKG